MNAFESAKEAYMAVAPPKEYPERVQTAIREGRRGPTRARRTWKYVLSAVACLLLTVSLVLNLAPALAANLYELPMLGQVAKLFTFWRFEEADESIYIQARLPVLQNTGNTALEERINKEITLRLNQKLSEAKAKAKDFYEAYLETGGKKDEYIPLEVEIDYTIKCQNNKYISFVVSKVETQASFYEEDDYYNIDLETGKDLTLKNLLGANYADKVVRTVQEGIRKRESENPDNQYFHEETTLMAVDPDQDFYINEAGNVVLVFSKYDLAPGYMGSQEFEVPPEK